MDEYRYDLPEDLIAQVPQAVRDASRLLVCLPNGRYEHRSIREFPDLLAAYLGRAAIVFNNSRVVRARLRMQKPTGGHAEVLLHEPLIPSTDPQVVLAARGQSDWSAMIGGRNIHESMVLTHPSGLLSIRVLHRYGMQAHVRILPAEPKPLSEILDNAGSVPLPPYIKRADTGADAERYQTVYAHADGSVAAPTAGLHFTEDILRRLRDGGNSVLFSTLHVGMGTFMPVQADDARNHIMHTERISLDAETLQGLASAVANGMPVVAVGTTSLRTIESVHWLGCMLREGRVNFTETEPTIPQFIAFDKKLYKYSAADSLAAIQEFMQANTLDCLHATTALMLAPGAPVRLTDGLFTNFHLPSSSLLLLVADVMGPLWRDAYAEAIRHQYRFLSYGDAMLIVRTQRGDTPTS